MAQKDEQDDEHDEHVKIAFRRNVNVWGDNSTRSEWRREKLMESFSPSRCEAIDEMFREACSIFGRATQTVRRGFPRKAYSWTEETFLFKEEEDEVWPFLLWQDPLTQTFFLQLVFFSDLKERRAGYCPASQPVRDQKSLIDQPACLLISIHGRSFFILENSEFFFFSSMIDGIFHLFFSPNNRNYKEKVIDLSQKTLRSNRNEKKILWKFVTDLGEREEEVCSEYGSNWKRK